MKTDSTKNRLIQRKSIILIVSLIVAIAFSTFNWHIIRTYFVNSFCISFKPGDKVYARANIFGSDKHMNAVGAFRLIRPINELDVDVMQISDQQKKALKKHLTPLSKEYLVSPNQFFSRDHLIQNQSAFIGTYVDHEVLNLEVTDKERKFIKESFLIIKTSEELIEDHSYSFKMPSNYTWANSNIYVLSVSTDDYELPSFIK